MRLISYICIFFSLCLCLISCVTETDITYEVGDMDGTWRVLEISGNKVDYECTITLSEKHKAVMYNFPNKGDRYDNAWFGASINGYASIDDYVITFFEKGESTQSYYSISCLSKNTQKAKVKWAKLDPLSAHFERIPGSLIEITIERQ